MSEMMVFPRKGPVPPASVPAPRLQRQCACEGTPDADEEQKTVERIARAGVTHEFGRLPVRAPQVRTRLEVSQPGDADELEAERMAARLTGEMPAPVPAAAASVPPIQRQADDPSRQAATLSVDAQLGALTASGSPLPAAARSFFEGRFGRDFGRVRVHADRHAAGLADALQARAFTVGSHIAFAAGEYAPETPAGRHLLAHELTHVVQQGGSMPPRRDPAGLTPAGQAGKLKVVPGKYSLRLVLPNGERFIGPPGVEAPATGGEAADAAGEQNAQNQAAAAGDRTSGTAPTNAPVEGSPAPRLQGMLKIGRRIQRTATFTAPTPAPQDPLARLAVGDSPGLTTPTINGHVVSTLGDVQTEISPTQVSQTGSSGGQVTAQFDRSFAINTSANMIVASNAGPSGWTGLVPTAVLGSPASCAGHPTVPATMNAQPSNADFVARVRTSEQQHANELQALHTRHFVPYDAFLMGLTGRGVNLAAAGQDLVRQVGNRPVQAAVGFTLGNAAQVERLDGPGGTHSDNAAPNFAAGCASVAITLSQSNPTVPGSGPGNVVTVAPTTTAITPAGLSVTGSDVMQGSTILKHFSSPAIARQALATIQHYGMTSRNVIGGMEFFLVGNAAPHGALAGVGEMPIDPALYQVTFGVPGGSDWAITQVNGNSVVTLFNFGARRNEAYSALTILTGMPATALCFVGGTRLAPEMLYFRN